MDVNELPGDIPEKTIILPKEASIKSIPDEGAFQYILEDGNWQIATIPKGKWVIITWEFPEWWNTERGYFFSLLFGGFLLFISSLVIELTNLKERIKDKIKKIQSSNKLKMKYLTDSQKKHRYYATLTMGIAFWVATIQIGIGLWQKVSADIEIFNWEPWIFFLLLIASVIDNFLAYKWLPKNL